MAVTTQLVVLALLASITPLGVLGVFSVSSDGRRANGAAFLAGWTTVLAVLAVAGALLFHGTVENDSTPSRALNGVVALIGVALIVLAFRVRSRPPKPDTSDRRRIGPAASFVSGIALAPYPVGVAAGSVLTQATIGTAGRLVLLAVFLVLATWSMSSVVVVQYAGSAAMKARLDAVQSWVQAHRSTIFFWLLLVTGVAIAVPALVTAIRGA